MRRVTIIVFLASFFSFPARPLVFYVWDAVWRGKGGDMLLPCMWRIPLVDSPQIAIEVDVRDGLAGA